MTGHKFDTSTKGRYVVITENSTTARRQLGFCDGVLLSDGFVKPGELVALVILETQPGWSGDLRIGLTLLPDELLEPLPSFALPELISRGHSWVIPVGTAAALLVSHRHRVYWKRQRQLRRSTRRFGDSAPVESTSMTVDAGACDASLVSPLENSIPIQVSPSPSYSACSCCLRTVFGRVPIRSLMPCEPFCLRAPDVEKGSVVAIYYDLELLPPTSMEQKVSKFDWHREDFDCDDCNEFPESSSSSPQTEGHLYKFRFHVVINGVDLIAVTENLLLQTSDFVEHTHCVVPSDLPGESFQERQISTDFKLRFPRFRAVFDVYGQTKAIQLVDLNQTQIASLSRLCCCAIVNRVLQLHYRNPLKDTHPSKTPELSKTVETSGPGNPPVLDCSSSRLAHLASNAPDNVRLQRSIYVLDCLPLPRSDRHRLQADLHAVVVRELEGALITN